MKLVLPDYDHLNEVVYLEWNTEDFFPGNTWQYLINSHVRD